MTRRTSLRFAVAALALSGLTLAACGEDADDDANTEPGGPRTIEIEMRDNSFTPDEVEVQAGETVRFVFENQGEIDHEAFIGDEAAQDEHEMEMSEGGDTGDGGMEHGDDGEEGGITVEPGESGELTHTFREGDELLIGCHEPGHYEAGMIVTIDMR